MTEKNDTADDEARNAELGRLATEKTERARVEAWLANPKGSVISLGRRNQQPPPRVGELGAADVEEIREKALGMSREKGRASAITYAARALGDWRRSPNRRIVADTNATERAAVRETQDAALELKILAEQYARRVEIAPARVLEMADAGKLVHERDRLRRPGHYFEDEAHDLMEPWRLVLGSTERFAPGVPSNAQGVPAGVPAPADLPWLCNTKNRKPPKLRRLS